MNNDPLVSVIIPTIGRATLRRAVLSALEQPLPESDLEVIVANDSGQPLDPAIGLPDDPRITVVTTNRRRQSVARNVGAAMARGRYLLFLDDDDWLAPNSLEALWQVAVQHPEFVAVYGGVKFVDETDRHLGTLNLGVSGNCATHMLAAALILFGSALIRSDAFFSVGGINPLLTISEEIEFFRRLSMQGDFGNTASVVLMVLRGQGYTTSLDYNPAVAFLRASREQILDQKGAFYRLTQSAREPYWRSRNVKAYAASVWYNLKDRRLSRAISRFIGLMLATFAARTALFHSDFWQALRDSQVPATAQRCLVTTG